MTSHWNPNLASLSPYTPGEQPRIADVIKLNTNELPYGPSPRTLNAMRQAIDDDLRRYPDPCSTALRQAVGHRFGMDASRVFVGNGSDEVLAHAFRALFRNESPILFSDITYGFYPVYCALFNLTYVEIPLTDTFAIDIADYHQANGGIIIANPNANTGIALPPDAIAHLAQRHPQSVIVVDEAYVDFGAGSCAALTREYDNVLVIQTLSKSRGLAGLRVGFALGNPHLIEGLVRVKDSFNSYPLSRIAQIGAQAAVEDEAWLNQNTRRVCETRERFLVRLRQMGFLSLPSQANFVLMQHPSLSAPALLNILRQKNILVRHLSSPRLQAWLRVSIGNDQEMDALCAVLAQEVAP